MLDTNERIIIIVDRIVSLQERIKSIENLLIILGQRGMEAEEFEEQLNQMRIEHEKVLSDLRNLFKDKL
jgi:hypothetical protein